MREFIVEHASDIISAFIFAVVLCAFVWALTYEEKDDEL